ncbi:hypothetical protein ABUE34_07535 [Kozakia baliensis]|uniref:hypothetical protein n=1 Tax=Kozakia baliensis TaxID=153496 RepID=UPI00345C3864
MTNTPNEKIPAFIAPIEQVNDGRSLLVNLGGFICVALMLGLANLICRLFLHTDLSYLLRVLIVAVALYFFVPCLILWLWTGKTTGRKTNSSN